MTEFLTKGGIGTIIIHRQLWLHMSQTGGFWSILYYTGELRVGWLIEVRKGKLGIKGWVGEELGMGQ